MKQRTTLADFLRSLPQGTILYSPLCGYVKVWEVNDSGIVVVLPENHGPELPDTLLSVKTAIWLTMSVMMMRSIKYSPRIFAAHGVSCASKRMR